MAYLYDTKVDGHVTVGSYITMGEAGEDILDYLGAYVDNASRLYSEYDSATAITTGTLTRNSSYVSSSNVGWIKCGKFVYVHGAFTSSTQAAWNSAVTFLSGLPAPAPSASSHGRTIHFGQGSSDLYFLVADGGQLIPSALNNIPAGTYEISGMYIAK